MTGSVPEVSHDTAPALQVGDLLARADGIHAVVLDATEDGSRLLVMTLPDGAAQEIEATDTADWKRAPAPTARLVEVFELDAPAPFFSAYLPDIQAAIAVYRAFEAREGDFRVDIYTHDEAEQEMLDGIGYYGAES